MDTNKDAKLQQSKSNTGAATLQQFYQSINNAIKGVTDSVTTDSAATNSASDVTETQTAEETTEVESSSVDDTSETGSSSNSVSVAAAEEIAADAKSDFAQAGINAEAVKNSDGSYTITNTDTGKEIGTITADGEVKITDKSAAEKLDSAADQQYADEVSSQTVNYLKEQGYDVKDGTDVNRTTGEVTVKTSKDGKDVNFTLGSDGMLAETSTIIRDSEGNFSKAVTVSQNSKGNLETATYDNETEYIAASAINSYERAGFQCVGDLEAVQVGNETHQIGTMKNKTTGEEIKLDLNTGKEYEG